MCNAKDKKKCLQQNSADGKQTNVTSTTAIKFISTKQNYSNICKGLLTLYCKSNSARLYIATESIKTTFTLQSLFQFHSLCIITMSSIAEKLFRSKQTRENSLPVDINRLQH